MNQRTSLTLTAFLAMTAALGTPPLLADEPTTPVYVGQDSDVLYLDNGMVIGGGDVDTPDGYTSGFRVTAGYSPWRLPHLDLGAEFSYHESDGVPTRTGDHSLLLNTTSLGGSLVAGLRLGQLELYAKSGLAEWQGDPVARNEPMLLDTSGTTQVQGFGARWQFDHLVSRLDFEEFESDTMRHLNLLTASVHLPF